ncbi:MAG TPA: 50S ribosomal protein L6 [Ruminiclostridium sp.]|nr:50S ribosomal protein L6 [Clostridiaceae bacterium]HAA25417.1 50S ribosomal protein L6 [Ruminiclostridium sp.]
MSRVGKKPVVIPSGVDIKISGKEITVKGPKGTLTQALHPDMTIEQEGNEILVKRPSDQKKHKALHGLTRSIISNMVTGVTDGFSKTLEVNGVGYRAQKQGKKLILTVGYSHLVEIEEPSGISIDVPNPNHIIVSGIDKQLVGEIAAKIRRTRPPEPYKGKGIKYADEVILRKEGKAGVKK